MNFRLHATVLLTVAFMLVVTEAASFNPHPCMTTWKKKASNDFVKKHILRSSFNTLSNKAWERYLKHNHLCHRPLQSFIEDQNFAVNICNGKGKRLEGNICISNRRVQVHDVSVTNYGCRVTNIRKGKKRIAVACDKIRNRCVPVHFENLKHIPNNLDEPCRPPAHHWLNT